MFDPFGNEATVEVPEVTCPKCGNHTFVEEYAKDKLYVCGHIVNTIAGLTIRCHKTVSCFCKGCGTSYPEEGFGKHGDVYECKECGRVCWPYTEYKQKIDAMRKAGQAMQRNAASRISQITKEIEDEHRRY